MTRCIFLAVALAITVIIAINYEVEATTGSIVDKIPPVFYNKIRKILEDIEKFKLCMVTNKACTTEEADKFHQQFKDCTSMTKFSKDDKEMKKELQELAKCKPLIASLSKFASKIGALMKCTK